MITADQVLTHKNDLEGKQRTANILNDYMAGQSLSALAQNYSLTQQAVYYLIKKNASAISLDSHFEKLVRVNRLKRILAESADPKAETIDDIVKLSSEMRKEIEGEKNIAIDNRQVNIYVSNSKDSEQILPALGAEENLHESKEV